MTAYWLNFIRHRQSFGHIIIELPITLQTIPGSNEVDMTAILSEKDMQRLGSEFKTLWVDPQPRFYLSSFRPGKFEYPDPTHFQNGGRI